MFYILRPNEIPPIPHPHFSIQTLVERVHIFDVPPIIFYQRGTITSEPMTNFDEWLVSKHLQEDGTDRLLHLSSSSKPWAVPNSTSDILQDIAGYKSCTFRFLQIVRVSIHHCQSPLSLSLCLSVSLRLSVLWVLSLYSFTQRSLFHPSITSVSSLHHWSNLLISIAPYRWLIICPGVILNPSQDPDRWLLPPSVSPFLQMGSNMSNASKSPDILSNWQTLLSYFAVRMDICEFYFVYMILERQTLAITT